jgi:hypothetical protein
MKYTLFLQTFLLLAFSPLFLKAQDNQVHHTFNATRIINSQSTETVKEGYLDIRISHRFGDIMKDWKPENSWSNFFGLEDAADIMIGFEYGLKNNLTLGISRTKGGSEMRQLMHGIVKYRPLTQTVDNKIPVSVAIVGTATWATMKRNDFDKFNPSLSSFTKCETCQGYFANRWRYAVEVHIARKFNSRFSLQLSPIFVWRNLVKSGETNALFSLNAAARLKLTKGMALMLDANIPFSNSYIGKDPVYRFPIGFGLEFETAGHIFQVNFTNSRGIVSTDYISDTSSDWTKGEFRLGFTISRVVKLKKVVPAN